jgi:hypothetical protein
MRMGSFRLRLVWVRPLKTVKAAAEASATRTGGGTTPHRGTDALPMSGSIRRLAQGVR